MRKRLPDCKKQVITIKLWLKLLRRKHLPRRKLMVLLQVLRMQCWLLEEQLNKEMIKMQLGKRKLNNWNSDQSQQLEKTKNSSLPKLPLREVISKLLNCLTKMMRDSQLSMRLKLDKFKMSTGLLKLFSMPKLLMLNFWSLVRKI